MKSAQSDRAPRPEDLRSQILLERDLFSYAHADFLPEELKSPLGQLMRGSRRASRRISNLWRSETEHFRQPLAPLTEKQRQVLLLSPETLGRLLLLAGSVFCTQSFARIIEGSKRRLLLEKFDFDVFAFVLQRATLLYVPSPALRREIPSILTTDPEELAGQILANGRKVFEIAFAAEPAAFTERLRLRFPASHAFEFGPAAAPATVADAISLLRLLATRELNGVQPC